MSLPNTPSLYDLLNGRQRILLNAVGKRANPGGQEPFETAAVSSVIEILESWLLDDEQLHCLMNNVWDIFFLYAGAGLLADNKTGRAESAHGRSQS